VGKRALVMFRRPPVRVRGRRIADTLRGAGRFPVSADPAPVLLPHLAGVVVEGVVVAAAGLLLVLARAKPGEAGYPVCGAVLAQAHSRYARRMADAAIGGRQVVIRLTVRRFFCTSRLWRLGLAGTNDPCPGVRQPVSGVSADST